MTFRDLKKLIPRSLSKSTRIKKIQFLCTCSFKAILNDDDWSTVLIRFFLLMSTYYVSAKLDKSAQYLLVYVYKFWESNTTHTNEVIIVSSLNL